MRFGKQKVLKSILVLIAFFVSINAVKADNDFKRKSSAKLYDRCNEANKCVKICTYKADTTADHVGEYENSSLENGEVAYIGYYYSEHAWEIAFVDVGNEELVYSKSTILPASYIYWSNWRMEKFDPEKKKWNEVDQYNWLKDKFRCPEFVTFENIVNPEMCLADTENSCKDQNESFIGGTSFEGDRSRNTYFANDVMKVINDTYDNLSIANADEKTKVRFLAEADAKFKEVYDASKDPEDNILKYCDTLETQLKDEKNYYKTLGNEVEYKNTINKQLNESATRLGVDNVWAFSEETLSSILTIKDESGNIKYRDIIETETSKTYLEKLHNSYGENINVALNYAKEVCNKSSNSKIDYDEKELVDSIKDKYETTTFLDLKFDKTTEFSCNSLGELAEMVKTGYFIIEVIGFVILIVFTSLDYAKVILNGEQDDMKKTNKRLATRLIVLAIILLLPALINFTLRIFNIEGFNSENPNIEGFNSENPLCVRIKNKTEKSGK